MSKKLGTGGRRALAATTALACAAADLSLKASTPDALRHQRGILMVVAAAALAAALLGVVPRLPSSAAAVAAGVGAGGALGNAVSALAWHGVPDPLVLTRGDMAVAFNLADVFALGGAGMLVAAAAIYTIRHAEALRRPL